jgi:hypothetical protein
MKKIMIVLSFVCISVTAQVSPEIMAISDTVLINDICIEQICFGDSINKLIKYFGNPDTVIYHPSEEGEFVEPINNEYYYDNLNVDFYMRFYEILHPGLTDKLLYGCRIDKYNMSVFIKSVPMIIGKTTIEDIKNVFPASASHMKGSIHDRYIHIYITIPPELKPVAGALIFQITLLCTNGLLKQIYTSFDLN